MRTPEIKRVIFLNIAEQMTRICLSAVLFCFLSSSDKVENSHFTLFIAFLEEINHVVTLLLSPVPHIIMSK